METRSAHVIQLANPVPILAGKLKCVKNNKRPSWVTAGKLIELKLVSHRRSGFIICSGYTYLPLPISVSHDVGAFPSLLEIHV